MLFLGKPPGSSFTGKKAKDMDPTLKNKVWENRGKLADKGPSSVVSNGFVEVV